MQIRLLTDASGADIAIAEAKVRYNALKGGLRPRTVNSVFDGFLIRVVLNLDPMLDRVDIVGGTGDPQEIVVISSAWEFTDFSNSLAGVPFRPLSQDPFPMRPRRLYAGGNIWAYGGLSGKPVVLTVNPEVIDATHVPWSQEDFAAVYPDIATLTETGLTISDAGQTYELLTGMPIYEFQIMNVALGTDALSPFHLTQGAGKGYAAAPPLYGGTFVFLEYSEGQEPALPLVVEGDWCIGGSMRVFFNNNAHVVMEGGFALGGTTSSSKALTVTMTGGPCIGGTVPATRRLIWHETMSGGFALGGPLRTANRRPVKMTGGFCLGGTMPVSSYSRPKQRVTAAMSGGFCLNGTATVKARRTVKLTGGFCLGGTMPVAATTTILKPIISNTYFTIPYESRTDYRFYATQLLVKTHYGGYVRFTLQDENGYYYNTSPGVTVSAASDGTNGYIIYSCSGTVFPLGTTFTVRAREIYTAPDGTTKQVYGDATVVHVTVLASGKIVASGVTGKLTWTGGNPPFTILSYGSVTITDGGALSTITATRQASVKTTNVCSDPSAYFVVRDSYGNLSNQVSMYSCGIPACVTDGGDGKPGYLDIDFYLPKSAIEVGQQVTLTAYPDSRGGAYSFSTGSTAVATVSGNIVRGNSLGSTVVTMTQQGKNGLNTTSLSKPLSVATNPWELYWSDFRGYIPTSKSCTTYTGSGYTVNFYNLVWLESRDGQYAVWYVSEDGYGCYTMGEDEYPSTTYPTWPTSENPFPTGITDLPYHVVQGHDLNGFGGLPGFGLPTYNYYYICYLYKRK